MACRHLSLELERAALGDDGDGFASRDILTIAHEQLLEIAATRRCHSLGAVAVALLHRFQIGFSSFESRFSSSNLRFHREFVLTERLEAVVFLLCASVFCLSLSLLSGQIVIHCGRSVNGAERLASSDDAALGKGIARESDDARDLSYGSHLIALRRQHLSDGADDVADRHKFGRSRSEIHCPTHFLREISAVGRLWFVLFHKLMRVLF